ncbi:hypothetical protein BMI86_20555 [Thioclava sp. DLFJ5-1]|uniref:hypothetical protein n=1 Tax=Thioclava sp. DLFJ5-1 TaxID=1915314 RepID=UPI0009D2B49A|nr:hypothetical protein [Thioclava sp. DLFJ5-1]OOY18536.1 hypothetical protein BMI86_20555 [Thioclava sp. DLFJ5-1]
MMLKRLARNQRADENMSLRQNEDGSAPEEDKASGGLTLNQAAVIYFGGLALLIGGMVVVGLST